MKRGSRNQKTTNHQTAKNSGRPQTQGSNHVSVDIRSPICLPTAVEDYYRSENQSAAKKEHREGVRLMIEGLGLVAAIILGIFTLKALNTARAANQIARENFKQDQRPYVWYAGVRDQPHWYPRSGQVAWSWEFKNFGKTPAHQITIKHWLTIGEGTPIEIHKDQLTPGAPLMPGEDRFLTAGSDTTITAEALQRILATTDNIQLHVVIQYKDAFGTPYETGICARHLASGPVQFCENSSGNYVQ